MILLFVSNKELEEVREFVESYPDRLHYRNPRYLDPLNLERADKVFIYGRHQSTDRAYRNIGTPVEFIDYKHDLVPSEPDKEPSLSWTIKELKAYAKLKGIEVEGKKAEILDAIISHS